MLTNSRSRALERLVAPRIPSGLLYVIVSPLSLFLTPEQAQKYHVKNTYSNYSSIATFDETGAHDYTDLIDEFENAYTTLEQDAGTILLENLQDRSVRAGLSLSGWKPKKNMRKQAVEWWEWGMSCTISCCY